MPSHYTNHFLCSQVRAHMPMFPPLNEENHLLVVIIAVLLSLPMVFPPDASLDGRGSSEGYSCRANAELFGANPSRWITALHAPPTPRAPCRYICARAPAHWHRKGRRARWATTCMRRQSGGKSDPSVSCRDDSPRLRQPASAPGRATAQPRAATRSRSSESLFRLVSPQPLCQVADQQGRSLIYERTVPPLGLWTCSRLG